MDCIDSVVLWIANNLMKQPDLSRRKRKQPMGVLAFGVSRTGTESLSRALEILGYSQPYHGFRSLDQREDWAPWIRAMLAKFRGIGRFEGDDWEQLLGNCGAVTDLPCIAFAPELLQQYPDAKVILTVRSTESWITSTQIAWANTTRYRTGWDAVALLFCWDLMMYLFVFYRTAGYYMAPLSYLKVDRLGWRFEEHNALIKGLVPSDRLLVYHVSEGWEPLCKFLGKPIPCVPMPRGNKAEDMAEIIAETLQHTHAQRTKNMVLFFGCLVAGAVYWFYPVLSVWFHQLAE